MDSSRVSIPAADFATLVAKMAVSIGHARGVASVLEGGNPGTARLLRSSSDELASALSAILQHSAVP